jgi:hypothetical protein
MKTASNEIGEDISEIDHSDVSYQDTSNLDDLFPDEDIHKKAIAVR